jgi:glc operon protein GlcG
MTLFHRILSVLALALLAASPLAAQTRQVRTLSADGAAAAMAAARAEAVRNNWNLSIAIVDPAGELLAFARMDGAGISTIQNALGKAVTSARFRSPTQRFDSLASIRPGLLTFENITAVEGGVPIVIEGVVVGAIGVSGASSAQDAQVGRAGAAAVRP